MSARPKIMLLACGSYNPVTPMHLRMFGTIFFLPIIFYLFNYLFNLELARDHFNETESHQVVGGILSPVHDSYRKKDLISSRFRISMAKISLKNSDWIRLSDWECQQEDWTRTRLTLQYHQNYVNSYSHLSIMDDNVNDIIPSWLPGNMKEIAGDIKLKLLCGADLLESFSVPGLWKNEDVRTFFLFLFLFIDFQFFFVNRLKQSLDNTELLLSQEVVQIQINTFLIQIFYTSTG